MPPSLTDTPLDEEKRSKAAALYKKYHNALLNFAVKTAGVELAEEIVQEAFINVFKHLDRIGEVDCSKTRNYLFKAVGFVAKHKLRKRRKLQELHSQPGETDDDEESEALVERQPDRRLGNDAPADSLNAAEARERLLALIERLPQTSRDVVIAFYYCNWAYKDIAEFYGLTVSNVSVILTRARAKLKKQLEEQDKQEKGEAAQ